jgi:hypothetical protein
MHSVNAVFLLGEAALNSLVSAWLLDRVDDHRRLLWIVRSPFLTRFAGVPLVPNRVLLPLDCTLRRFPVDCPRGHSNLVRLVSSS